MLWTMTQIRLIDQYIVQTLIPPHWGNVWGCISPSHCPIVLTTFLYMLLYLIPDQNNLEMLFLILPQAFHSQSRLLQHFDPGLPRLLWALTASNVSMDTRIQGVFRWRVPGNWCLRNLSKGPIWARHWLGQIPWIYHPSSPCIPASKATLWAVPTGM